MNQLITKINEINRAEKYIAEAIILEKGTDFQESIPTYNIRVFNGNPDARAIDIQSSNILYQVPIQVSREGEKTEDLKYGDKVLVGYFNNDLNSPYIMFNQTTSQSTSGPISGVIVSGAGGGTGGGSDVGGDSGDIDTDTTQIESDANIAQQIADYAKGFVGKLTYSQSQRNGINNGGSTADCSSYVEHVFAKFGYQVGSNTAIQHSKGQVVGDGNCSDKSILDKIDIGDIILVSIGTSFSGNNAHAGIKVGNDEVVHMGSSGCQISSISGYFFSCKRWDKYAIRRHAIVQESKSPNLFPSVGFDTFNSDKPYDFTGNFTNK